MQASEVALNARLVFAAFLRKGEVDVFQGRVARPRLGDQIGVGEARIDEVDATLFEEPLEAPAAALARAAVKVKDKARQVKDVFAHAAHGDFGVGHLQAPKDRLPENRAPVKARVHLRQVQHVLVGGTRIGSADDDVVHRELRPEGVPARRDAPDAHLGVQLVAQKAGDFVLIAVDLRQQDPARGEHERTKEEIKEYDAPEKRQPGGAHARVAHIGPQSDGKKVLRQTHAVGRKPGRRQRKRKNARRGGRSRLK